MRDKEASLEEMIEDEDLAEGLDLDTLMKENENIEVEPEERSEKKRETKRAKGCKPYVPPIKINCDLEVRVGSKNRIIYVCPGKLQFFTATAKKCSGDEIIEIEYCGHNTKCICGEAIICGCLGYYKIVKSGIIFIPRRNLSRFPNDSFPIDILCFKAKSKCDEDVKFDVVFTYSKCVDC